MSLTRGRDVLALARSWGAYAALPAVGIVTAPILAHALGPEGRGQLAAILQPMTLAAALAALGVPSAVTYFIGRGGNAGRIVKFAIIIALAMTLIVGALLAAYSAPVARQIGVARLPMLAVWMLFLPSALLAIRRAHVLGLRRYATIDLERLLIAGVRLAIITALWLAGVRSVMIFAGATLLPGLCASCVLWLSREPGKPPQGAIGVTGRGFASYALLSSFGTIASAMSARLDQAIMPAVVPVAELGYYSIAVAVAEISAILTQVSSRNVLAEASAGFERKAIARPVVIGGFAQVLLIAAISLSLPYVVPIAFGRDFTPAVPLVRVLLLGAFIGYWASAAAAYLTGTGKPGLGSSGQGAAAITTGLLFWLCWHRMDAMTAAWINVAAQGAGLLASVAFVWLSPDMRPEKRSLVDIGTEGI